MPTRLDVFCDSDHAGCLETRRSTTGVVVRFGRCLVKTSSNIQSTIALSSGESEYYALVKAAAVGLSLVALLRDWDIKVQLRVSSDSSAAKGTASRLGLGKLRHVDTRYLWLQERIYCGHLKIQKIPGTANPSDVLTKTIPAEKLRSVMERLGSYYEQGRSTGAPDLV